MRRVFIGCLCALFAGTPAASAQDATRWGVSGSFVPTWAISSQLSTLLVGLDEADTSAVHIEGSEFRIGFVRGRELGGDWGLSLVRKRMKPESVVMQSDRDPVFDARGRFLGEVPAGFSYALGGVTLTGLEYHRFRPFTTIKERVQIGLTYGGGAGWLEGLATGVEFGADGTRRVERPVNELFDDGEVGLFSVAGYTLPVVPLARLELTVGGLVAPGLKVRASGGFNFPGYETASISVVYLFGSR